jgi:hypothetical protein
MELYVVINEISPETIDWVDSDEQSEALVKLGARR